MWLGGASHCQIHGEQPPPEATTHPYIQESKLAKDIQIRWSLVFCFRVHALVLPYENKHPPTTAMELFKGKTLVKKDGSELPAEQVLSGKKVVGLYFSAHWCPPCRMFTPILAEAYEEAQEGDEPFEIVFVSSDRAASEMLSYMKESHGNWCGLKHGDPLVQELKQKFGISGIPTLVVVNESGQVITSDGRSDISSEGPRAFAKWLSAA